jgi:hypothetical protein
MNKNPQIRKQALIGKLIKLVNGQISAEELKPQHLCIKIGYGLNNVYLINDKQTTKEQFDEAREMQASQTFAVSYEDECSQEVLR